MGYVYRMINNDSEIIYVGKTDSLTHRMYSHKSKGAQAYKEAVRIEYIKTTCYAEMSMKEIYYIDKYIPKYNFTKNYTDMREFEQPNPIKIPSENWITFKGAEENEIIGLRRALNQSKEDYTKLNRKYESLLASDEHSCYQRYIHVLMENKKLEDEINCRQEFIDLMQRVLKASKVSLVENRRE